MMRHHFRVLASVLLLGLIPALALAQTPPRLGMVTALTGEATVTRPASPEAVSLQYKDSLSAGDRLWTAERSVLRVILRGSSALLSMGQLSLATLAREGSATVVELEAGKIYVGVVAPQGAAPPSLTTEIRTPNAVVIFRGTSVVMELTRVGDPRGRPTVQTTLSVLSGTVEVLPRRAGSRVARKVGANTAVSVVGDVVGPLRQFNAAAAAALMTGLKPEELQHSDSGESIVEGVTKQGRDDAATDAAAAAAARRQSGKKASGTVPGLDKDGTAGATRVPIMPGGASPAQVGPQPKLCGGVPC